MARPVSIFKRLTRAYEQQLIAYALVRCRGDVQAAATLLGIDHMTLRRHQAPLGKDEEPQGGGDAMLTVDEAAYVVAKTQYFGPKWRVNGQG